jgi:hypothetical protein
MGVGFSTAVEDKILHWLFKQTAFGSPPTALWCSLHSPEPDEAGSNELSGGAYGRAQLDPDANSGSNTNWNSKVAGSPATSQRISNKLDITFPTATANWNSSNPIGFWGLFDASTSGTFLVTGPVGVAGVVVLNGNTLKFPGGTPGNLYFQVD